MVYVTSDLHGLPLSKLKQLLDKVNFNNAIDWLYILGDVVDRQNDGGIEILKWLLEQPNAQIILGNHEAMLLSSDFIFEEITEQSIENLTQEKMELLNNYLQNGGDVTIKALRSLMQTEPDTVRDILEYLREAPLYESAAVTTATGTTEHFLLVHAGLGNFDKNKKISDYTPDELLWVRPEIADEYFSDVITVFGHTPTYYYGEKYKGKVLRTRTWIDIDVGVSDGNSPVLLRLDDLKEFYL